MRSGNRNVWHIATSGKEREKEFNSVIMQTSTTGSETDYALLKNLKYINTATYNVRVGLYI